MRWIDHVYRIAPRSTGLRKVRRICCVVLVAWGCASTPGWAAAGAGLLTLDPEQMDGVTAGRLRMDLELSAMAQGPSAMTSTQGSVTIGQTTASRVAIDPSAPMQARARLLGQSAVQVGIAAGKAQASGAKDATCSVTPAITGSDYTILRQSQTFTALTATCSCTALAIGFLSH